VKPSWTPLAAALASLGLAASLPLSGCKPQGASSPPSAAATAAAAPTAVRLATPRPVQSAPREEVTGSLFPAQGLQVGFEVGGRLAWVAVKKGQKVKQGELLAVLDTEISDAQVAQAQAGLAAAEAGASMADDMANRNAKLQEQGNVSEVQSRTVSTQARQAQAQLLAARATLAQAQAARRKHELKAPFAGTVIEGPEQAGATVGPGMPLFALERLDSLLLKTTVSEAVRERLREGTRVRVESVSGSASSDEASIRTIVPSADPASRRIPVDIIVPNAEGRFVAHTLARVVLPLGEPLEAQALPSSALGSSGGDHVLVAPEGVVRRVPVQVLERREREVIVKAASPLAQVIDYPTPSLAEGTRVSTQ
jgi:RND family efflux transporter MFP subunit